MSIEARDLRQVFGERGTKFIEPSFSFILKILPNGVEANFRPPVRRSTYPTVPFNLTVMADPRSVEITPFEIFPLFIREDKKTIVGGVEVIVGGRKLILACGEESRDYVVPHDPGDEILANTYLYKVDPDDQNIFVQTSYGDGPGDLHVLQNQREGERSGLRIVKNKLVITDQGDRTIVQRFF